MTPVEAIITIRSELRIQYYESALKAGQDTEHANIHVGVTRVAAALQQIIEDVTDLPMIRRNDVR